MRAKLLVSIVFVLWAWVLPMVHAMPIDADGPSGLSDNADFDDLILSLASPTAAVASMLVVAIPASFNVIEAVAELMPIRLSYLVRSSVESRAPPVPLIIRA